MKTRTFKVGRRGHIAETIYGTYMAYVYNHGTRERRCFKSFKDAEDYVRHIEAEMELPALTQAQILDCQLAYQNLPHGLTLREVVQDYIRLMPGAKKSNITLSQALEQYIASKQIRSVTAIGYRAGAQRIIEIIGDRVLHDIEASEAQDCIRTIAEGSLYNGLSSLKTAIAVTNWAIKRELIGTNIWLKVDKPKLPDPTIAILSVNDARLAIEAIAKQKPQATWYFAIGMFAGVRPKELMRMNNSHIRDGYIYLDGSITKTKSTRSIKVADNLAEWLKLYPIQPLPDRTLASARKIAIQATTSKEFPADVMRHSFASYLYELTHDATLVASELGHSNTTMLFKHYRALAISGSGKEYFNIFPK